MGDGALVHTIEGCRSSDPLLEKAKKHLAFFSASGDMYQRAIAFKYEKFKKYGLSDEVVSSIGQDFKEQFLQTFQKPSLLSELEDRMEKELGIPFVCSVLPDPEKVRPADLPVYEGTRFVFNLRDYKPKHYEMLEEHAEEKFAIRLLVPKDEQVNVRRYNGKSVSAFYEIAYDTIKRGS